MRRTMTKKPPRKRKIRPTKQELKAAKELYPPPVKR